MIAFKKYLSALAFSLSLLLGLSLYAPALAAAPVTNGGGGSTPTQNQGGSTNPTQPVDQNTCDSSSNALCGKCNTATYHGDCIASQGDPAATTNCTKSSCDLIHKYVNPIINVVAGLVGLIAVGSIIMGGIQFSSSAGDPQKAAAARGRIANTIFALLFFFFLYAFLQFLVPGGIFNS